MPTMVPIYIPTQVACELVEPHPLGEILESMMKSGLIQQFYIGEDLVRIFTTNKKRFEIANMFAEECDSTSVNGKLDNRKKLSTTKKSK